MTMIGHLEYFALYCFIVYFCAHSSVSSLVYKRVFGIHVVLAWYAVCHVGVS